MIKQDNATIIWNRSLAGTVYSMGLTCSSAYQSAVPGQFVMVQTNKDLQPLLRRPFSISSIVGNQQLPKAIELLYKVVGKGTGRLSGLKPGQQLSLLGPLGKGFAIDPRRQTHYLAAGGIGVAPIRFLAQYMKSIGIDTSCIRVFIGGQSQDDLLCQADFEALGIRATITTDDGSAGDQCLITDPLAQAVQKHPPDMVYACGPRGMLACVAGIARQYNVACQVSIETMMACGIGACLGCAVQLSQEGQSYLHACLDGPVFDAKLLAL
ncbi:MAG: dihydroorotate dehydrogenase electron transfer subunit [Desulfobacteraceae bacterium]|nr:dihydroorotate dehydrogenase electron transfer subunit [Desulfobacteraceae bacterium]